MDFNETPPKIFIYESELDFISRCVMDFPNKETGGDFFGLWTKDGFPVVQYAIGPGERTTQTASSFFQDIAYLKECGFLLNDHFGLEHVGAWHSHHQMKLSEPSTGDIKTMQNALHETGFSRFVISICNIEKKDDVAVNGFLFSYEKLHDYTTCNWHILKGTSPVREAIEKKEAAHLGLFRNPETESANFYVKNTETEETLSDGHIAEKPDFPKNSYWKKEEGKQYLKNLFNQMKEREDITDVEMIQLADKRVAVSFKNNDTIHEIRFPHNFPKGEPEVVEKVKVNDTVRIIVRSARKQKSSIRRFFDALNIFERNKLTHRQ